MGNPYGRVLSGDEGQLAASWERFQAVPVDQDLQAAAPLAPARETTLARPVSVSGPGTFFGRAQRRLTFEPAHEPGWWFDRDDLPEQLPIRVTVENVWTTVRNIVLCSGSPHNYMRMVEHIIALKEGLGLDNVMIRMESGDPPLFDRGSLDLVEAVDQAGLVQLPEAATYLTVREPVSVAGPNGSFLVALPAEDGVRRLELDCALDFKSAIGRQRLRFVVTPEAFRYGALARTNTTFLKMLFCRATWATRGTTSSWPGAAATSTARGCFTRASRWRPPGTAPRWTCWRRSA